MAKIVKILTISIFLFRATFSYAQDVESGTRLPAYIENGDTILQLILPPVYVFPSLNFSNKKQEKFYWKTVRDVKRTLPYAKAISITLKEITADLDTINSEKERKKYMKSKEKDLLGKYEPELKKLTLSQGKMLIKLIDRECDKTSYELIKEFRGGMKAFFWQGFAKLFGADLKSSYSKEENQIIERVIILVDAGQL